MSLVVAEQTPEGIVAGADTAVTCEGSEIYEFHEPKVFVRGEYLFGFCGSARIGQVMAHHVELPDVPNSGDLTAFLVRELVPAIRKAVETHGAAYDGNLILGPKTNVIVGCRGELFCLSADLVVARTPPYVAIGTGRNHAYATMFALNKVDYGTARERVEIALEAGAAFTPSVRGPWVFATLRS